MGTGPADQVHSTLMVDDNYSILSRLVPAASLFVSRRLLTYNIHNSAMVFGDAGISVQRYLIRYLIYRFLVGTSVLDRVVEMISDFRRR